MADITASNNRYSNIDMCPNSGGGALVRVLRKTAMPGVIPLTFISPNETPSSFAIAPEQSDIANIQRLANESGALGVCQQQVDGGYGLFLRYGDPELALRMVGSSAVMTAPRNDTWLELDLELPPPSAAEDSWKELDLDAYPEGGRPNISKDTSNPEPLEIQVAIGRIERDGDNPDSWKELARAYAGLNRSGEAYYAARYATLLAPDDPAAHHLLGQKLLAIHSENPTRGFAEMAIQSLVEAVELDPDSIEIRIDLAKSLAAEGNDTAAHLEFVELLDMAIERGVGIDDDTLYDFANLSHNAGYNDTTVKALKMIGVAYHSYSSARFLFGKASIMLGDYPQATSAFLHAVNIVQNPTYQAALGISTLLNGDHSQAIIHLGRAARFYEKNAPDNIWFALCIAHIALKNSDEAIDSLEEYIEALSNLNARHTNELDFTTQPLLSIYPESATRTLQMALERAPNNFKLHRILGLALLRQGKHEETRDHFFASLQLNTDVVRIESLARMSTHLQMWDIAVTAYQRLVQLEIESGDKVGHMQDFANATRASGNLENALLILIQLRHGLNRLGEDSSDVDAQIEDLQRRLNAFDKPREDNAPSSAHASEASQFAGFINQNLLDAFSTRPSGTQAATMKDAAIPLLDPSQLLIIGGYRFGVPAISVGPKASSPTPTAR